MTTSDTAVPEPTPEQAALFARVRCQRTRAGAITTKEDKMNENTPHARHELEEIGFKVEMGDEGLGLEYAYLDLPVALYLTLLDGYLAEVTFTTAGLAKDVCMVLGSGPKVPDGSGSLEIRVVDEVTRSEIPSLGE